MLVRVIKSAPSAEIKPLSHCKEVKHHQGPKTCQFNGESLTADLYTTSLIIYIYINIEFNTYEMH